MLDRSVLAHDWWPVPLPPNVVIGERSWLYSSFAFLHYRSEQPCGLRVGHNSGLYIGTCLDLGPQGEVRIGNYCTVVGTIISSNGRVTIGDYAFVAYGVVVADSFAAVPPLGGKTAPKDLRYHPRSAGPQSEIEIGDNVWIGVQATLLNGARLGEGVIVGAASVVNFEVPDYAIVAGNPARVVGWARPEGRQS
jgi:acetyltransferase-like isoleucine patch superfamily enzyme